MPASRPCQKIESAALAQWIEAQPDVWWSIDGDPKLLERVDFPCPSDELARAFKQVGGHVVLFDPNPDSKARGDLITAAELDDLADTDNPQGARTFLCSWENSDVEWLLTEEHGHSSSAAATNA